MMSTRDFECKQIAFVFTSKGEKISFKNDNLLILDEEGKVKHQSTCYRLFLLFIIWVGYKIIWCLLVHIIIEPVGI